MPAKKRYKIEKKVREHNRKLRKIQKIEKAKNKGGKAKRRLIIVPGDCPFKDKILSEVTTIKENLKLEKLAKREQIQAERKAKKEKLAMEKRGGAANSSTATTNSATGVGDGPKTSKNVLSFEDLVRKAQERGYEFEKVEQAKSQGDASLKAFYKQFQQVEASTYL